MADLIITIDPKKLITENLYDITNALVDHIYLATRDYECNLVLKIESPTELTYTVCSMSKVYSGPLGELFPKLNSSLNALFNLWQAAEGDCRNGGCE